MQYKQRAKTLAITLRKLPVKWYVVGTAVLIVIWYGLAFGLKQPVSFAYSGQSCVPRLTVLPNLHSSLSDGTLAVELQGGAWGLFSTQACIVPTSHPQAGKRDVATAPFGGWVFRQHYAVTVPAPPVASVSGLKKPLSTTRALTLPLDQHDTTFSYRLRVADKQAECAAKQRQLSCDVASLKLAQGETYTATLIRSFGDIRTTLASRDVTTLPAVTLATSSVQPGEIVYAKPSELTLEMDKPLRAARAELVRVDGDVREPVATTMTQRDKTVTLTAEQALARDTQFELRLTQADADDGSGLDGPVVVPFRTSGGPKPTGVSANGQAVPLDTTATITFDQPLSQTQDIAKLVQVTGAPVEVSRTANQLRIRLVGAPKCTDVTITIDKGLLSEHDIATTTPWKHAFRTTCRTVSTIGYSVRGRAIQAYHYGNGSEAILFVGGIHGNEQSSSLILHDLIKDLDGRARSIPAHRQVVVVPTLNPDGYAASARNNTNNVNLNRNFATSDWVTDLQDTNGEVKGGGGSAPMSEPETRAIAALSQQLRPRFVLSYHAVGSVVIGNTAGDAGTRAAQYASSVGYRNGTGRDAEIFDYAITGTYDDWLAQRLGVPSMIVELGSYTYRNYGHHKPAMWQSITN